ncbi:hypothetical protein KUV89_17650 [Marinobacter hydrocarbonoclasticus]|nr:hypothetical protein [Marinobacter nauticus]
MGSSHLEFWAQKPWKRRAGGVIGFFMCGERVAAAGAMVLGGQRDHAEKHDTNNHQIIASMHDFLLVIKRPTVGWAFL